MRESLKEAVFFLIINNAVIIYSAYALVAVIIAFSVFSAWRSRGVVTSPYDESVVEYSQGEDFVESIDGYETSQLEGDSYYDEDYSESSRFDEIIERFAPKLISGLIISLLILGLVALPYFIIDRFV